MSVAKATDPAKRGPSGISRADVVCRECDVAVNEVHKDVALFRQGKDDGAEGQSYAPLVGGAWGDQRGAGRVFGADWACVGASGAEFFLSSVPFNAIN